MKLEGTVALVSGGARRVGRAIVLDLAQAGCDVAIHHGHSEPQARELAELVKGTGQRSAVVAGDLKEPANWLEIIGQTIDSLGRLDILVNNASIFLSDRPDTVDDFDADLWEEMLRTNLIAPMGLVHSGRQHLAASGCGKIINLCDISAERPWPNHIAYCCSKAALVALTKALAVALAPRIQVNGISPGIALFPDCYSDELRQSLTNRVPLQREGTPAEIARLVRFLAESGDYMTGEIVHLDGGRRLV